MRFNYRWLCEFLKETPPLENLCHALTMGGIEVEEAIDLGSGSGLLVVGEVLELEAHPNADKLRLVTLTAGENGQHKVVCGAPNVEVGKKYPLALEGMELPGGFKIRKAKIRGVESRGMLCSARELGWSEDSEGLLTLPDDAETGAPFDALIDTKVTPNRPDCLSIFGIARDTAALAKYHENGDGLKTGKRLTYPRPALTESLDHVKNFGAVKVEDAEACPRYMARVIRDVAVGPSPLWMQRRLEAAGLRAINNAVDITNYVLLELGQPLHAFDLDQLAGNAIVVRRAAEGEKLRLLDDTELKLIGEDLVIADSEKPQVLAGVMGGETSEVTAATKHILLECAQFDPATIRRQSKRHIKSSESSYRFERGIDREQMPLALDRAASLIAELCGGQIAKDLLDVAAPAPEPRQISVSPERTNRLLGTNLDREQIGKALAALGFVIEEVTDVAVRVTVPSFRLDVSDDHDLIEEVARVVGFDKIEYTMPSIEALQEEASPLEIVERQLRRSLVAAGCCETLTYTFIDPKMLPPFAAGETKEEPLKLLNPLSPEVSVMRTHLVPSLMRAVALNQRQRRDSIALFELGMAFHPREGFDPKEGDEPVKDALDAVREEYQFAAAICGDTETHWRTSGRGRKLDFYDLRGLADRVMEALRISNSRIEAAPDVPWLHPGRSARIIDKATKAEVVLLGQIHPDAADAFDLRDPEVFLIWGQMDALVGALPAPRSLFRELPKQPAVELDMALVIDETVTAGECEATIRKVAKLPDVQESPLESLDLFDIYRGEHLEPGKKSLAFRLVLRLADRSLTQDEVNALRDRVAESLAKNHAAALRT